MHGPSMAACAVLLLTSLSGCTSAPAARPAAAAQPAAMPGAPSALEYTIGLDAAFSTISVRLCMQGAAPGSLVYGSPSSMPFVRAPRVLDTQGAAANSGGARALTLAADRIMLDGVGRDACVAYDIDLARVLAEQGLRLGYQARGAIVTGVELFLFRPPQRAPGLRASARFVLPGDMQVSVPWPERDGHYVLDERAFAFTGHVAFGRFAREQVPVPGGVLDVALLEGFPAATRALVAAWLSTAGEVVAGATGVFPARSTQVIVVPTPAGPRAIRFGHTGRSGGPSILLFMPDDSDLAALREDWIAVHEFCHLLHPFVRREDAWLSEGLATYLQDVLRTRAGLLTPELLWRRMYEGSMLGTQASGTLEEETKIMPTAGNYQRVYWAGAAIVLMADVQLRRRSHGQESLDSVLAGLAALRDAAERPYSAQDLLSQMDAIAKQQVFAELGILYARAASFPRLEPLYRELGVRDDGRNAPAAPLSWIRDAVVQGRVPAKTLALFRR